MIPRGTFIGIGRKFLFGELCATAEYNHRLFSSKQNIGDVQKKGYFEAERDQEVHSVLKVFASKKNTFFELHRLNPLTMTKQRVIEWKNRVKKEVDLEQQKYISERHEILGSDLATAHFIVHRGGKVRFEGGDWIELNKDEKDCSELPNKFVRNMFLHSVDASNTNIRYEGLDNFTNLTRLKWLSFQNCCNVDNWFLDRITGEFNETLEYLDISECKGITEEGLSCIYKLKNLKTLCVTNIANTRNFEFMCLLLEDGIPGLTIEGVTYLELDSV